MALSVAAAAAAALVGVPSQGVAATFVWNNTGPSWEAPTDWTPTGPPTAADVASFDPTVVATAVMNPTINATTDVAQQLLLADNYLGTTYNVSGAGTLTLGTGGVLVRGFGPQTINGPTLAGNAAGNLAFNVGNGASLTLTGTTTATTNPGAILVIGGTLTVDNSASTVTRLAGNPITLTSSGTLSFLGNAAGTTVGLGALSVTGNLYSGLDVISVTPNGATTKVNFANGTAGTGFALRPGTRAALEFAAGSGVLGDPNGAQITFTGTPFQGSTGLLATTAGGTTQGFAVVKDSAGVNFATYNTANGVVSVASAYAGPIAVPVTTTATPAGGTTANVQFNPTGAVNSAANASGTSIRISPTAAGASLNLTGTTPTTNTLATNALMLDGPNDFAITGTGVYGVGGTRYIYVNNPTTTLSISQVVDGAANPTVFAGPGIVALTGTASQNTNTDTSRFSIAGGVVRGNNTQIGFKTGVTTGGVISFGGGVLEITGGTNGTGTAADFTRPLGTTGGSVTFGALSGAEAGSGGFSAFGAAASVNLGGAAAQVVWNTLNFLPDGAALKFGSVASNAVLTFQNPVGLDAGTAGTYAAREVNVTAGTGGDKTILSGVISGSASTDLVKTGTGTLVLTAANTFAGRTLIEQGTLAATTLAGPLVITSGGTITTGTGPTATDTVATLTDANQYQTWVTGGQFTVKLNAGATGTNLVGQSGELVFGNLSSGSTGLTINPVQLTGGATATSGQTVSYVIADATASATAFNNVALSVNQTAPGFTYSLSTAPDNAASGGTGVGEDLILTLSSTAAPEPASLLLAGLAAAPLTLGRRRRRTA